MQHAATHYTTLSQTPTITATAAATTIIAAATTIIAVTVMPIYIHRYLVKVRIQECEVRLGVHRYSVKVDVSKCFYKFLHV